MPGIVDTPAFQVWAGIDGDSLDFQPIPGAVPGLGGFYLAVGSSVHRFKLGPIIGKLLTEMITHSQSQTMDVSSLGIDRFEKGTMFPPGYKQTGA